VRGNIRLGGPNPAPTTLVYSTANAILTDRPRLGLEIKIHYDFIGTVVILFAFKISWKSYSHLWFETPILNGSCWIRAWLIHNQILKAMTFV